MTKQPYISEATLMKYVGDYLKARGVLHWRNNTGVRGRVSFGKKGAGDFIVIKDGRHIELECKSSSGEWEEHQQKHASELQQAGAFYAVVRPHNWVEVINEVLA